MDLGEIMKWNKVSEHPLPDGDGVKKYLIKWFSEVTRIFFYELGGLYDSAEIGADIDAAQPKEIAKPVTQTISIPKVKSITEKKEEVKDAQVVEETVPASVQAEELPPFEDSESPAPIEPEKPRRGRPPSGNHESRLLFTKFLH